MVVTGWKLVNLVLMFGLLLGTAYGQNSQQVSEENEQKLLEILQETNFRFEIEIETTFQEEKEEEDYDQFSTIDEPSEFEFLETPNPEKNQQTFEKTTIPESILKFADFVQQYKPQKTGGVAFETHLDILAQNMCQKDFPNFGRLKFNAVGTIRISFENGREKYCTGTLIDKKTVITSAECYQKSAEIHQFQPSWADDTVWLPFQEQPYISDNYVRENGTSNFALFFLKNSLDKAPRIGYEIAVTQTQQCYITLLGWINSLSQKHYKMVTCPELPEVEDQLGIESENCGEISCKLDNMGFQTGSPIVLTCPTPIKHTVIGVLYMRNEEDLDEINFPGPNTIAYPYMFDENDYWDIKERVRIGTSSP